MQTTVTAKGGPRIRKAVGIHLGTTSSAIALLDLPGCAILTGRDEQGRTTFPPQSGALPQRGQLLHQLRAALARTLGDARYLLDSAVLTVPASGYEDQLEAARQAGELAGFEVVELLPEPAAAACYYAWAEQHEEAVYLVCAPFDVSVVRHRKGDCELLGSCGKLDAGDDCDRIIACCHDTLRHARDKAGIGLGDVDYILLAGEGSRVALSRAKLRATFCDPALPEHVRHPQPLLHEPELCIAYGAAVRAAGYGTRWVGLPAELELHLSSPTTHHSPLTTHQVTGVVYGLGAASVCDGGSVRVRSVATGLTSEVFLDCRGAFGVDVELAPEADNDLEVAIVSPTGDELAWVPACVRQRCAGPPSLLAAEDVPVRCQVLEPPWPRMVHLVRHCLDLAAKVADATGRPRQELFEHVYAQERYGEQAHGENNQPLYRECFDNLGKYAGYLEQLLEDALPRPPRPPSRPPEEVARSELERFRSTLAEVWKKIRARGRTELDQRLARVAQEGQGLSLRVRTDPQGVLLEVRRLIGEIVKADDDLADRPVPPGDGDGLLEGTP
jgi:hypothetical protein